MTKIHDISDRYLADVPRQLRKLAAQIEKYPTPIRACIVVIDYVGYPLAIQGFGNDADHLRTIGLLQLAGATLTNSIISVECPHGPGPDPAA
ncbi:MAG: hypothetical protein AB7Q01_14150 [Gammaproteobacteria bacterium]